MEVKSFGVHISNVAPGDFATNIAAGRYHAPVILLETPYGNTLKRWMSMDGGSNPNEMAKQFIGLSSQRT
jgi:hypothetical protein